MVQMRGSRCEMRGKAKALNAKIAKAEREGRHGFGGDTRILALAGVDVDEAGEKEQCQQVEHPVLAAATACCELQYGKANEAEA
jgi:hypothetical protein